MIWCWVQAILLSLAVVLSFLLPAVGFIAAVGFGVVAYESAAPHIPALVKHGGKYILRSVLVLIIVTLIGAGILKAQQQVCSVGFKAAWSSVWK